MLNIKSFQQLFALKEFKQTFNEKLTAVLLHCCFASMIMVFNKGNIDVTKQKKDWLTNYLGCVEDQIIKKMYFQLF
jgi:hypothetical protein